MSGTYLHWSLRRNGGAAVAGMVAQPTPEPRLRRTGIFWAEGYYVSTVGLNEATIQKYIQEQEKHDIAVDKLSVKEYEDPFKGSK